MSRNKKKSSAAAGQAVKIETTEPTDETTEPTDETTEPTDEQHTSREGETIEPEEDETGKVVRKYDVVRIRKGFLTKELTEAIEDFKAEVETRKAISEKYEIEETEVSLIIWKTVKE